MRVLKVIINIVASIAVFVITAFNVLAMLDGTMEMKKGILILVGVFTVYMILVTTIRNW